MSTRCQIGFYYDKDEPVGNYMALIYRHCDGYPGETEEEGSGVLPDIIPFLKSFRERRGNDPEYAAARLLQYLCSKFDSYIKELYIQSGRTTDPETGLTGYGIHTRVHGDIDYFYRVNPDEVLVYRVKGSLPQDETEPDVRVALS